MKRTEAEADLALDIDQEFIDTLAEAVKICGWDYDLWEVEGFIAWLANLSGYKYEKHREIYEFDDRDEVP